MKVITDTETIDLGITETTPTIGITDYSIRTTDDFGVTTVTPRAFSRTLSAKMLVTTDQVDSVQRTLAGLRATSARWVADDRFAWLGVTGFYKDFSIELATQTISYCTLTVEGLGESEVAADAGGDPAPIGANSTLQLLQPVAMTDQTLVASSVAEADAPAWDGAISYAAGTRVERLTTHRVYQSLSARNAGNTPETSPNVWLDLGPTNRWAMFDQALGTATTDAGSITVTLNGSAGRALALLDVTAATVRVQADGYDHTQVAGAGAITFLDLPDDTGQITITITGSGQVSVGTLLIGKLVALGITEASPTAGIDDYSRKDVDAFGEVTIVQRAWAKTMAAKALIRIEAIDMVASRIASVRAVPSLWLGQAGLDSLTVYGFFKDFSIEASETTAMLSLTIEGLSTAPKVQPLTIDFDNVTGDDRPQPGATRNVPRGAWSASETYAQGDVVTYQGSSYIAGENVPFGTAPTNATYWDLLANAGAAGAPGENGANGKDGANGIPGAPGANGQPSYVHVAYSSSADGSQDFVSGQANPGRAFIGIYTDANASGSSDYHVYNWSRLTGQNGTNGTNGTPGPVGPDGRQSYVHFAYADSATGSVNFTTGAPGARTYIGVYSDYTAPDSNDPTAYSWSLIKGSDGAVGAPGANGTNGAPGANGANGANGKDGANGANGAPGANAPQVIIQYSADKANWHAAAAGGDIYLRLSYDGGATFGNAILIQGGGFVFAFYRTTSSPPAPSSAPGASVPPAGWASSDPGGSGQLWFTFARIDGSGYNLTGWNAATKVQGQDGANGAAGAPGSAGATGATGQTGATGPQGSNGVNGADGASVFTFTDLQNCGIRTARTITKANGGDNWNGLCRTDQMYAAATVSARLPVGAFVGLDESPGNGNWSYTNLNAAWHRSDDGYDYWVYWNGSQQVFNQVPAAATGALYTVAWDGKTITFIRDAKVIATAPTPFLGPMCGEFCIYHQGATIYDIAFAPGGLAGNDGSNGAAGPAGPPGPAGSNGTSNLGAGFGATLTISLAAGATAQLTGAASLTRSNGGGTVTCGLQWSYSGYNSWNTLASDGEPVSPGEPATCNSVASLTNSGSSRRLYDVRYAYVGGSTANLSFDSANSFISAQVPS